MLAVLFIYLYLGNFGSIQQFVCFNVLSQQILNRLNCRQVKSNLYS